MKALHIGQGRPYARLLSEYQEQQEELNWLKKINEEQAQSLKRLDAELYAMTKRYLEARKNAEEQEKRRIEVEARLEVLASRHRDETEEASLRAGALSPIPTEGGGTVRGRLPIALLNDSTVRPQTPRGGIRSAAQSPARFPSTSPGRISPSLSDIISGAPPSASNTHVTSEDITKLARSINLQSLEIARTCIGSATFRAGVRVPQVTNEMINNVTQGIGFVLLQMLREKDHSRDRTIVELALQAILIHHVAKIVENWPFPLD